MKKLVIVGAGAHSAVIIDIFEQMGGYEIIGLTDEHPGGVLGYPVLGSDALLPQLYADGVECAFAAIGNNSIRSKVFQKIKEVGFEIPNAISPRAVVSRHCMLADGIAVMPGAVINARAKIENGVIINTKASVDHDCLISEFVHVAPGCSVSGSTTIGAGTLLGTGTSVIDRITIGKNVIIGAGAAVVCNIPDGCKAMGVPAKMA